MLLSSKFSIELFSAAQSNTSLESIQKSLKFDQLNDGSDLSISDSKATTQLIEEFLTSTSLTTHPNLNHLKTVLDIFNNDNRIQSFDIKQKATLTLGSLISLISEPEARAYIKLIATEMENCETIECKFFYLEAIKNSRTTASFEIILEMFNVKCLKGDKKKLCVYLARLMRSYGKENFRQDLTLLRKLLEIFYNFDSIYVSDLRMESLNILIEKYDIIEDRSLLENVLNTLYLEYRKMDKAEHEFLFYSQRYILQKIENDHNFRF